MSKQRVIDVVSLGTALLVPESASAALKQADLVIGAKRQFDAIECGSATRCVFPTPIDRLREVLAANDALRIVVLASGDALFFGIGSWLLRNADSATLQFHPNVTTVQSACARIGKPWQEVKFVSLHGRPIMRLRAALSGGISLAVFTDDKNTPMKIAAELCDVGYGDSQVWVCESLDTDRERVSEFTARELAEHTDRFDPLNLVIADVCGDGGLLPDFPGIADDIFAAGGDNMFTKREVRLAALTRLQLKAGEIAWDIGAGSGGIAIELARWAPQAKVVAIERNEQRRMKFAVNNARFGDHGNLELIAGDAPDALEGLPDPNAVYIGGSGGNLAALLDVCWQRLKPGGRLVAAGVTVETRAELQNRTWPAGVSFADIAISHAAPLGSQTTMRAQLPVLLATTRKV